MAGRWGGEVGWALIQLPDPASLRPLAAAGRSVTPSAPEARGGESGTWGGTSLGQLAGPARTDWEKARIAREPGLLASSLGWLEQAADVRSASLTTALSGDTLNPLRVIVGTIGLQPDQDGQWVTIQVENISGTDVAVAGLNFSLQVADTGPASEGGFGSLSGPKIQAVDLAGGTPFAGNNTGTQFGGGPPQAGQWSITTASGTVTLKAGETFGLGRVQFDTRGFQTGTWPVALTLDVPSLGIASLTAYVDNLGGSIGIDLVAGQLTVVPEPWGTGLASATLLVGVAWVRRHVAARRNPRAPTR